MSSGSNSLIQIVRFFAAPTSGQQEWVELHNGSNVTANLGGWQLDDAEGGSAPVTLAEGSMIAPGQQLQIALSHSVLNNSGDDVRLLAADSTLIDQVHFAKAETNQVLCHQAGVAEAAACAEAGANEVAPAPNGPSAGSGTAQVAISEDTALPESTLAPTRIPSVSLLEQDAFAIGQPYLSRSIGSVYRGIATTVARTQSTPSTTTVPEQVAISSISPTNNWSLFGSLLVVGSGAMALVWQRRRVRDDENGTEDGENELLEVDEAETDE